VGLDWVGLDVSSKEGHCAALVEASCLQWNV
jgi:hypothetical protein